MDLPEIILWIVVLAVGLPSAWRNPTAGALVLCWIVAEGIYTLTGNGLAVEFYLFPDFFVIAVIAMKPEACNLKPYRGALHQLKCMLLERSVADRIVLSLFPVAWYFYVADVHPYTRYWVLWFIALAQYAAAGGEALAKFLHDHKSDAADSLSGDEFRFAWVRGGG